MSNLQRAVARSKHGAAICYVGYGANYYARTVNGRIVVRFNGFNDDCAVSKVPAGIESLEWLAMTWTRLGCDIEESNASAL